MTLFTLFVILLIQGACSTHAPQTKDASVAEVQQQTEVCQNTATTLKCVKVVEVYDGDTIFIDIPGQHPLFGRRMGVRIIGIDTPEIKSKDVCEKQKAVVARDALQMMIQKAKTVDIVNVQKDKFFRILGKVVVDGQSVGDELIKQKLAYPYHGDKKIKRNWCSSISK